LRPGAQNALPSPIRKLTPLAERAKAEVHIYHLNIGQPDLAIPQAIIEGIQSFKGPLLPYAPSNGIAEAVDAWRAYYRGLGMEFERQELCITMGGSEALMLAMMATCDPGDEILVFEPTYANTLVCGDARSDSCQSAPVSNTGFISLNRL
jgi:aspartate aminotransferase